MSKPFDFIEKTVAVASSGITWLPYALGGVAAAGLASVPMMGVIKPSQSAPKKADNPKQELTSSESVQGDPLPIATPPPIENDSPILTPNPEDPTQELQSVDETLADLGLDFGPDDEGEEKKTKKRTLRGREVAASQVVEPKPVDSEGSEDEKETGFRLRRVKNGDTLFGIASESGTTPAELAKLNGIDPEKPIFVGQELKVPGEESQLVRNSEPLSSEKPVVASGAVNTSVRRPRTVTPEQKEVSANYLRQNGLHRPNRFSQ